jgi:RHS repeat-associated protein
VAYFIRAQVPTNVKLLIRYTDIDQDGKTSDAKAEILVPVYLTEKEDKVLQKVDFNTQHEWSLPDTAWLDPNNPELVRQLFAQEVGKVLETDKVEPEPSPVLKAAAETGMSIFLAQSAPMIAAATAGPPEPVDLFHLKLAYDEPLSNISAVPQRNGNISWAKWRVGNRDRQIYRYNYDGLDRMRTGQYYKQSANGGYGLTNWFGENLTYDLRGNIKTLNRQAPFAGTNCYTVSALDNLTYVYDQNNTGNKVMSITDVGAPTGLSAGTGTYTYTTYGALKTDTRKGITDIRYNHLQLPDRITYGTTGNSLQWIYDAEGNKLRKIATFAGTTTTTDYCNGMEYIKKGTAAYALNAIYHSEGRVKYTSTTPRYEYTLTDHLGNGRVYYTDLNADGAITTADILQDNHYYPFGLNHTDPRRNTGGLGVNKYQYNGKELVDEGGLGWHSYGKRYYDAAIGRFPNVDPLIDTFHFVTGYNYAENEPVAHIDLWGLQAVSATKSPSALMQAGENLEFTGDLWGKAQVAAQGGLAVATVVAPEAIVVTAPTFVWVTGVVGTASSVTEFSGKALQHLDKEINGIATPKDRVNLVFDGVMEFAVPEVIEQTLKETNMKDAVREAVTGGVSETINWLWDQFKN